MRRMRLAQVEIPCLRYFTADKNNRLQAFWKIRLTPQYVKDLVDMTNMLTDAVQAEATSVARKNFYIGEPVVVPDGEFFNLIAQSTFLNKPEIADKLKRLGFEKKEF